MPWAYATRDGDVWIPGTSEPGTGRAIKRALFKGQAYDLPAETIAEWPWLEAIDGGATATPEPPAQASVSDDGVSVPAPAADAEATNPKPRRRRGRAEK